MAYLTIGGVYAFTKKNKNAKPILVYIDSGKPLPSNCWYGQVVRKDGSLGRNVSMQYCTQDQFEPIADVEIKISGKGLDEFYEK